MATKNNIYIVREMARTMPLDKISERTGLGIDTLKRYLRKKRDIPKWNGASKDYIPHILLLDIETTPIEAYAWRCWKENISQKQIEHPSIMLSWAAKWLFDTEIISDILTKEEVLRRDNSRIVKNLWILMEEADIVVAHNGQAFDIHRINTEFLLAGLGQPSPYKVIDTCLVARKYFGFEHNTLDFIAERLGLTRKIETDFQLWIDCIRGYETALAEMIAYNRNDVLVLEEVYVKLRPWIKDHPNMGLFMDAAPDEVVCRNCGSKKMVSIGNYYTPVNIYESFRCECGAIGRRRKSQVSLVKHPHILQGIS